MKKYFISLVSICTLLSGIAFATGDITKYEEMLEKAQGAHSAFFVEVDNLKEIFENAPPVFWNKQRIKTFVTCFSKLAPKSDPEHYAQKEDYDKLLQKLLKDERFKNFKKDLTRAYKRAYKFEIQYKKFKKTKGPLQQQAFFFEKLIEKAPYSFWSEDRIYEIKDDVLTLADKVALSSDQEIRDAYINTLVVAAKNWHLAPFKKELQVAYTKVAQPASPRTQPKKPAVKEPEPEPAPEKPEPEPAPQKPEHSKKKTQYKKLMAKLKNLHTKLKKSKANKFIVRQIKIIVAALKKLYPKRSKEFEQYLVTHTVEQQKTKTWVEFYKKTKKETVLSRKIMGLQKFLERDKWNRQDWVPDLFWMQKIGFFKKPRHNDFQKTICALAKKLAKVKSARTKRKYKDLVIQAKNFPWLKKYKKNFDKAMRKASL